MRKIIIILIVLLLPVSAQGQVFDLVRSIQTSNTNNFLYDTADGNNFSHTGTMTIESRRSSTFITIVSSACRGDVCVEENSLNQLLYFSESGKSVVIDNDSGTTQWSIISRTPTVILMKTKNDETVELTEWLQRQ